MNEKKIALITPFDITKNGGSEIFTRFLKEILEENGFIVDIFDEKKIEGNYKNEIIICYKIGKIFNKVTKNYYVVICNGIIGAFINHKNIINMYHGNFYGYFKALGGKKNIRTLIGQWLYKRLEKNTLKSKIKVAVSESTKNDLEEGYGFKNIRVINNYIDTSLFSPLKDKNTLRKKYGLNQDTIYALFTGRWEKGKGIDLLENIFLESRERNIHYIVATNKIGDDEKKYLEKLQNVTIFKNVPHGEIQEIYQLSNIFIFPSFFEGCSLSLMEALSCGLVSLSSNTGSAKDIKESNSILSEYIITSRNLEVWMEKIDSILTEPKKLEELSLRSREYALNNYQKEKFISSFLKLL